VQTTNNKSLINRIFSYEYTAILALLAACLLIGVFIVRDYGETWDENTAYRYGNYAINAYQYFFHPQDIVRFESDLNLYGPAYFIFLIGSARVLQVVFPRLVLHQLRPFC